jgi:hypothetical protein
VESVLEAVGLQQRDLFSDPPAVQPIGPRLGKIMAAYDYIDEHDTLLYQCLRYAEPEKSFRQRRPDGHGGWHWNLGDVRRVLYRLPHLVDMADVFIVEGEKDTHTLEGLGVVATTNAGGAGKWRTEYADQLVAAGCLRVVVLPDNDEPGAKHGRAVAASCHAAGLGVKLINLPGLPPKGDVSDWVQAGGSRADLAALVSVAPTWTPDADTAETPSLWAPPLPDLIANLSNLPVLLPMIVGFIMTGVITLLHGQPRDWKSLVALHVAVAVATGRPLFGLARLSVPVPCNVLYLTEEDGVRRVTERLQMICAGMGCAPPGNLFVAAGTGFSLDEPESRARLTAFVKTHNIALVIPDPLRSLSGCVDQGPKELRPLTLTLRALMLETTCTIFAVHHDSKPLAIGVDGRRRPQRASGGAVFSIADSPIGIDALPDGRRLISPTAWKFGEDPPAVVLTIESGDGWLRLVGQDADGATSAGEADLGGRILAFLASNPRANGRAIVASVKARKSDVFASLDRLARSGRIDSVRLGRSMLWFVCDEKGPEPLGNHPNDSGIEATTAVPDAGTLTKEPTMASGSMVPQSGNHAEQFVRAVPDTGGVPGNGSCSYIGTVPGNHATGNAESENLFGVGE